MGDTSNNEAIETIEALQATVTRLTDELKKADDCDSAFWFTTGQIHELANEHNKAEFAYRRALDIEPNHHSSAGRLGVVLMHQGRIEEAISVVSESVQADNKYLLKSLIQRRPLSICSILGDAYRISGNLVAANALYRAAANAEVGGQYGRVQAVLTSLATGDNKSAVELANGLSGGDAEIDGLVSLLSGDNPNLPKIAELAANQSVAGAEMTNGAG